MKISVISPSNRKDGLDIVKKSLDKQTFSDFEWLTCGPYGNIPEPQRHEGDFYNLNKAWNKLVNEAKGELLVSIVDYTQCKEDTLERLWQHYIDNPLACISGVGVQYKEGKIHWVDPRVNNQGFFSISPIDMEFRLCSVPKRAIQAVGGFDEEYDRVAAVSEKELCLRMGSLGYKFFIDQELSYIFYNHGDHDAVWQERYNEALTLLNQHTFDVLGGRRLRLGYVNR